MTSETDDVLDSPDEGARRWSRPRLIAGMRCEKCHSAEVAPLPAFSTGSGTAMRGFADDIICRKCGHIASAAFPPR